MPKKIVSEKFQCEVCGNTYDLDKHAEMCEEGHKKQKLEEDWRAVFPTRWRNDDRWNYHCVLCGVQLLEFKYIYEGHETEVGEETYHYKGIIYKLEGGRYCETCYNKARQDVIDAWDYYTEYRHNIPPNSNDYMPYTGEIVKKGL